MTLQLLFIRTLIVILLRFFFFFFLMSVSVCLHSASKAVDCLLDSKWAKAKKGEEALFTTRDSVLDYCNRLAV